MRMCRSDSLDVINGMAGLAFFCDDPQYIKIDKFMGKGPGFWSKGSVVLCKLSLQAGYNENLRKIRV